MSQQLSFGLHEILKTTAANIHTTEEWSIIFTVLEYVGAGKVPSTLTQAVSSGTVPAPSSSSSGRTGSSLLTSMQNGSPSRGTMSSYPTLHHSLSQDPIPQLGSSGPIGYSSGSDRGYTSDSELEIKSSNDSIGRGNLSPTQSWILVSCLLIQFKSLYFIIYLSISSYDSLLKKINSLQPKATPHSPPAAVLVLTHKRAPHSPFQNVNYSILTPNP
jgi:hypothetical protein